MPYLSFFCSCLLIWSTTRRRSSSAVFCFLPYLMKLFVMRFDRQLFSAGSFLFLSFSPLSFSLSLSLPHSFSLYLRLWRNPMKTRCPSDRFVCVWIFLYCRLQEYNNKRPEQPPLEASRDLIENLIDARQPMTTSACKMSKP